MTTASTTAIRMTAARMAAANLDLGVIGNGSFGALVDAQARVVWSCLPAFDGDPAFCALLSPRDHDGGDYAIELEDYSHSEQSYLHNTAILRTRAARPPAAGRWKSSISRRAGANTSASSAR